MGTSCSSNAVSTTGAAINGSTQKRNRKRGTDDAGVKNGASSVENTSEGNIENVSIEKMCLLCPTVLRESIILTTGLVALYVM